MKSVFISREVVQLGAIEIEDMEDGRFKITVYSSSNGHLASETMTIAELGQLLRSRKGD